jgi:hypothetical protein
MSQNTSNLKNLAIGLIIALLGLSGFLGYKNYQLKKENTQKYDEIILLQKAQAELDGEYQAALSSLENLKNDNQELNNLIEAQKEELKAQKTKISNLIWTKRELDKAKKEIDNLNLLTSQYLADVNKMKKRNAELESQNLALNEQNETLTVSLNQEKTISTELKETKTRLMTENQSLSSNNNVLSEKVDIASAIKINYMSFTAGSVEEDGNFKSRKRTKKMDAFQTCFKTETNIITPQGEETFMVRILNENGETLSNDEKSVLVNKLTGEQTRYSASGKMMYKNNDTEGCVVWTPSFEIAKGNYTVEIYNKGFRVGAGTFKI